MQARITTSTAQSIGVASMEIVVEYLEALITESPREHFSKVDILVLLNLVKNDPSLTAALSAA